MTMLAYHGTVSKSQILGQLRTHALADEIVKGQYWENGKGCAVGCAIHSSNHAEYEPRFGIPQILAHLEDCIFEGLPNDRAKEWPLHFMGAIEPGQDLSRVGWQFLHWLLTDDKVNPGINHPRVRAAVKQCADVLVPLTKGGTVDESAWSVATAAASAEASAESAWSAAESAAESAAARAAESAWSAASAARAAEIAGERAAASAWSASESAASAARAAESAGASAAKSAWSAESAWSAAASAEASAESAWCAARAAESAESAESASESAASAARAAAYVLMADKLIELIKEAPVVESAQ